MAKEATMTSNKLWAKVGVWSYVVGLLIAFIASLFYNGTGDSWVVISLAILGLIVGLMNIGDDEVQLFLLGAMAFVIAGSSMGLVFKELGPNFAFLTKFMGAIVVFTAPGALVVAFKALYHVARDN